MRWMTKTKFQSLDEAVKSPNMCKTLNLFFIKEDFKDSGSSLEKLRNLRKLYIQGDPSIYYDYDFNLPTEIGELTELKELSLLNLPIKFFPDWVFKLRKLEYLMIRGTDITNIPGEIFLLNQLITLRVENCPLKSLPCEMNKLKRLKNLGLSDTKLTELDLNLLPTGLKRINTVGSGLTISEDKLTEKNIKCGHV